MAHKTLVGGTAYEISGGKTLVGGTAYSIKNGKTLVGGTAYEITFVQFNPIIEIGVVTFTRNPILGGYYYSLKFDTYPNNMADINAIRIDGDIIPLPYSKDIYLTALNSYRANFDLSSSLVPTKDGDIQVNWPENSTDKKVTVNAYSNLGTYDIALGTI